MLPQAFGTHPQECRLLDQLPRELLVHLCSYLLDDLDVLQLQCCCGQIRAALSTHADAIWWQHLQRSFDSALGPTRASSALLAMSDSDKPLQRYRELRGLLELGCMLSHPRSGFAWQRCRVIGFDGRRFQPPRVRVLLCEAESAVQQLLYMMQSYSKINGKIS